MSGSGRWMQILAGAALAAVFAVPAGAVTGDSGQAGAFMTYGAGARAFGMGRAYVGLADDASAVYWNPGGLSGVPQNTAMLQHVVLIDNNSYEYLGYTQIFPYIGTLGVGISMLNQPAAEGRDTYNEVTDSFTNQQLGVLLGFGSDFSPVFSGGGAVKIVNQSMLGHSASSFGLDLGLMYRPWPQLNVGLAVQNVVAPSLKLVDEAEKYPMTMTLGLATHLLDDRFRADLDISKNADQGQLKPRLGVEAVPMDNLFIRAGMDDTEIAVGAGYRFQGFQLDYALGLQTVELMHKVSLAYLFGGYALDVHSEPGTFSPVGINKVSVIKINCHTKFEARIWRLEIRNEAGALVKKYSGEGLAPDHVVWNGLQDDTNPMPDGKYTISFSLEDAAGETKKAADATVNIQSVLPLGVSPVEME